jgi:hypothetical protein
MMVAEGSPEAMRALYAAGPGQSMAVLQAIFAHPQAEGCFWPDLSRQQLCKHFNTGRRLCRRCHRPLIRFETAMRAE